MPGRILLRQTVNSRVPPKRLCLLAKNGVKEHRKGEDRDPVRRVGSPCSSALLESCLTFVSEGHKQVGVPVNQGAPILEHTLIDLLCDMRSRAQVAASLAERISL